MKKLKFLGIALIFSFFLASCKVGDIKVKVNKKVFHVSQEFLENVLYKNKNLKICFQEEWYSYNDYLDAKAAWELEQEYQEYQDATVEEEGEWDEEEDDNWDEE